MIQGTLDTITRQPSSSSVLADRRARLEADGPNAFSFACGNRTAVYTGAPQFRNHAAQWARERGAGAAWLDLYEQTGTECPNQVGGSFALAIYDAADSSLFLAVDRFSVKSLCYGTGSQGIAFAERADRVAQLLGGAPIDRQGLFDYLYFHMIPSPRTVFSGVARLRPGHFLLARDGTISTAPWWRPTFDERDGRPFAELSADFRRLLEESVAAQAVPGSACFLSGGTDSSTVAGMVGAVTGKPARTYSIGFDAEGYDEMSYARIAARHFHTEHHEYYVTPEDLVRSIPTVAASYDQPFGNSSALPGYYCARMASADGNATILAGDGGDELFGGNTRYAKQRVFEMYQAVPKFARHGILEPMLLGNKAAARLPVLGKMASYVGQARTPMPDRMQMYNLLFRLGLDHVLEAEFLAPIDVAEPLRMQRETYAACAAPSLINRMLAYDWKYTLADSDLPKVVGTTSLAGIAVGFPLLDDRLVDFSLSLAPKMKLRGLSLRWFFKEALRGFLPEAIIAKKKHGFGLPFGLWAMRHAPLKALAIDSLQGLKQRGIVRPQFIDDLVQTHLPQHPGYYGEMVWILMMLEQWLAAHETKA
jgi:asparagine synthase (glutamine-hydrolysing)